MSGESPVIRVLIVDDHEMFAESLRHLLADEGDIEVVGIAGSNAEATEATRTHMPDVVLMDYRLPDGPGTTAVAQIKEIHPEVHVVVLTAFPGEEALLEAIEVGCDGFLTKEQTADEAISAIREVSVGEAIIAPAMLTRLLPRLRREEGQRVTLTSREQEILVLLAEGTSTRALADRLAVSVHTVRNHVQNLLAKLGAHSKLEAVVIGARLGLIHFPEG